MELHEVLQTMTDNAKPNADGEVCTNGHLMHNLLLDNKPIRTVGASELEHMMYSPERFSLAPRTHEVNGFTVPAPESTACNMGSLYYIPDASEKSWFMEVEWENDEADDRNLKRGLVHVEPRHAIANAKAEKGIDPYSEGEK